MTEMVESAAVILEHLEDPQPLSMIWAGETAALLLKPMSHALCHA